MNELILNKTQMVVTCLIFLMLFVSYPFVFDRLLSLPDKNIFYLVGIAGLVLWGSAFSGLSKIPKPISISIFVQIIVWVFFYLIHEDTAYITRIFFLIITSIILAAILQNNILRSFVRYNNIIITVQCIGALIAFILVFAGLLSPLFVSTNTDGRYLYFLGFSCTNIYIGNIMRPSGFFDEPGALAFWGMYALILNKIFYDNKKIEILLIVGLLSTLSIAYFIQIVLYFTLFYIRNFKRNIPIILVLLVSGLYVNSLGPNSEIYNSTIGRLTLDDEGHIHSSRYKLMDLAKEEFMKHPTCGVGASKINDLEYMGDNPYETLATDGIVGTFAIYLPLIWALFKYRKNKVILFSIIIIATGYLQRPFHVNLLHYIMIYLLTLSFFIKNKYSNEYQ